jgi:hypothetical protein
MKVRMLEANPTVVIGSIVKDLLVSSTTVSSQLYVIKGSKQTYQIQSRKELRFDCNKTWEFGITWELL